MLGDDKEESSDAESAQRNISAKFDKELIKKKFNERPDESPRSNGRS